MGRFLRFLILVLWLSGCIFCLESSFAYAGSAPAGSIPDAYAPILYSSAVDPLTPWWPNVESRTEDPLMLGWAYRPLTLTEIPPGIQVFAPTWVYVNMDETTGLARAYTVSELGRETDFTAYIDTAHQAGAEVWVTAVSFTPEVSDALIHTPEAVDAFIDKMITVCGQWHADGVNLDFENMNPEHKYDYNAFAARVTEALNKHDLIVSADVTVPLGYDDPSNWWQCYDRAGLARSVDYVAVMTYDQHIESTDPGPVGGLDWVEEKIRLTLAEVPSDKLLLGVPFYARDFRVMADGSTKTVSVYPSQVEAILNDGRYTSGSMDFEIKDWHVQNERQPDSGVLYLEFTDQYGNLHRIWYDDEVSMAARAALSDKYHLAGVAAWAMSFSHDSYWQALQSEIVDR